MHAVGFIELAVCQAALVAAGQSGLAQHLLLHEAVHGVGQAGLCCESSAGAARSSRGQLQLLPVAARAQHGAELLQAEAAAVHVVRVHAHQAGGAAAAGEALQLHHGSQPVGAEGPEEARILLVGPGQGAVVEGRQGSAAVAARGGLGLGGEAVGWVGAQQPGRGCRAVQPTRGQHVLLGRRVSQLRAARVQLARVGQGS